MAITAEVVAIGYSALIVATVAIPFGAFCALLARRWQQPIIPAYRKRFSAWLGFDVALMLFLCLFLRDATAMFLEPLGVFPILIDPTPIPNAPATVAIAGGAAQPGVELLRFEFQHRRSTIAGLLLIPLFALAFHYWKVQAKTELVAALRDRARRFVADCSAGVLAWFVLAPLTFAVHFVVNIIAELLGLPPDEHPLKRLPLRTNFDVALLFLGACVVAPVFEEMGYRRLLVPWTAKKWQHSWILIGCALAAVMLFNNSSSRSGPIAFVMVMAGLLFGVQFLGRIRSRFPIRPASAILSTATLFAAMHSTVWPTPIPLAVLGMGLGWLVLRTKTVTAAVIAHGLFNAISALYMLRGSP